MGRNRLQRQFLPGTQFPRSTQLLRLRLPFLFPLPALPELPHTSMVWNGSPLTTCREVCPLSPWHLPRQVAEKKLKEAKGWVCSRITNPSYNVKYR